MPLPDKTQLAQLYLRAKNCLMRHCCSMRAMSVWPASAAMSAAVLLSLQRRLGVGGDGDGVGWRRGGGGVKKVHVGGGGGGGGGGTHEDLVALSAPAASRNSTALAWPL